MDLSRMLSPDQAPDVTPAVTAADTAAALQLAALPPSSAPKHSRPSSPTPPDASVHAPVPASASASACASAPAAASASASASAALPPSPKRARPDPAAPYTSLQHTVQAALSTTSPASLTTSDKVALALEVLRARQLELDLAQARDNIAALVTKSASAPRTLRSVIPASTVRGLPVGAPVEISAAKFLLSPTTNDPSALFLTLELQCFGEEGKGDKGDKGGEGEGEGEGGRQAGGGAAGSERQAPSD